MKSVANTVLHQTTTTPPPPHKTNKQPSKKRTKKIPCHLLFFTSRLLSSPVVCMEDNEYLAHSLTTIEVVVKLKTQFKTFTFKIKVVLHHNAAQPMFFK